MCKLYEGKLCYDVDERNMSSTSCTFKIYDIRDDAIMYTVQISLYLFKETSLWTCMHIWESINILEMLYTYYIRA